MRCFDLKELKSVALALAACVVTCLAPSVAVAEQPKSAKVLALWNRDLADGSVRNGCRMSIDPINAEIENGFAKLKFQNAGNVSSGIKIEFLDQNGEPSPLKSDTMSIMFRYSGLNQSKHGPLHFALIATEWFFKNACSVISYDDFNLKLFNNAQRTDVPWTRSTAKVSLPEAGVIQATFSSAVNKRGVFVSVAARNGDGTYAEFQPVFKADGDYTCEVFHSVYIGGCLSILNKFYRPEMTVEAVAVNTEDINDISVLGAKMRKSAPEEIGRNAKINEVGNELIVPQRGYELVDFNWLQRHERVLKRNREGPEPDLLFFGDSVAVGWIGNESFGSPDTASLATPWQTLFGKSDRCYGFPLDRTNQILWRIANGELDNINPKILVLFAGTDHLWPYGLKPRTTSGLDLAEGVIECVRKIKEKLPNTKLIVTAVLPVGSAGNIERSTAGDANRVLQKVAETEGYIFMPAPEGLLDDGGGHVSALWRDFFHLSDQGYFLYYQNLKPLIEESSLPGRIFLVALIIIATCMVVVLLITFIHNRILKREKLLAERANAAKTSFLFSISHDIRTPMNAIIGFIDLASKEVANQSKAKDYLHKAAVASEHLLSLINDVLEMSRIESGHLTLDYKSFSLSEVLSEVNMMMQESVKKRNIRYLIESSILENVWVVSDRLRLKQILLNILGNSVNFTPEGGSIFVSCVANGSKGFVFMIRDTGCGMSHDFIKRIFEPFSREYTATISGVEGTGLGMTITKNLVDLMGGKIEVSSEKGRGTQITVTLPMTRCNPPEETAPAAIDEEEEEPAEETDEEAVKPEYCLLLVEDNAINREIALEMLEELGYKVETANNGREAVDAVSEHPAGYYAAILMDVQMPEMDGYEATRAIRKLADPERARIPIIAMTANAFAEDCAIAIESGMNEHLAKPVRAETLDEMLKRFIR